MSDIIHLLPDSVANQIAAGEVIQRPASVIKELVENAVDAGATEIHVLVVDAGRTSIQVIDNGKGMSETDARLAFERHATSKIQKADDLFSLHTMGFRGEALPSIAAVAQVELKTRLKGDDVGTHLSLAASKFQSQEPCNCPEGSNFLVENLFYNVPARRKFLKSNTTELNNIVTAFERIALVYPEITFTLHSNGVELFNLRKGGLRQRIVDVFGKRINQMLLPVNVDTTMCKITGFTGKPEAAKKKGARQYFFVNGRYMKHAYFNKAIMTAYDRLLPPTEQVPYFIYFTVDPSSIDVNIHPTKTEIKFDNEQAVWQILMASIRDAVGLYSEVPTIDFDTEGKPEMPVYQKETGEVEAPHVQYSPAYNPFKQGRMGTNAGNAGEWEKLYGQLPDRPADDALSLFGNNEENAAPEEAGTPVGAGMQPTAASAVGAAPTTAPDEPQPMHYQFKGKYILTSVKSGLMIIDQHRAHIRILYERFMQMQQNNKRSSQKELFPQTMQLRAGEVDVFRLIEQQLTQLGFDFSPLGNNCYAVNAVPAGIEGINTVGLLEDMIHDATHEIASGVTEKLFGELALKLARSMAIPYGQILSNSEMENIINKLFACSNVNYTPDGKNVLCILKLSEIENLLG